MPNPLRHFIRSVALVSLISSGAYAQTSDADATTGDDDSAEAGEAAPRGVAESSPRPQSKPDASRAKKKPTGAARASDTNAAPGAGATASVDADRSGDDSDRAKGERNHQVTPPSVDATRPKPPAASSAGPKVQSEAFTFGSYGRVNVASNLRGGLGRTANIVAYGTRIDADSYAELELRRDDVINDGKDGNPEIRTKIVGTLALFPPFFHFSGKPEQSIGVRNLFAQATYNDHLVWVGSRMYRGDDIYLLNWWPLDNQNTVGGGVATSFRHATGDRTNVALHAGMQRLDNRYQYQAVPVVSRFGVGAVDITKLDRPRTIETFKITHLVLGSEERPVFGSHTAGFKVKLYGEAHQISAGVGKDPLIDREVAYPSDSGFLVGTQLGLWSGERDTHVNLFFRHARGIAAYDPLAVPLTFANDKTTSGASETLVALGTNYERGIFGVMAGSYLRFFRDGGDAPTSTEKYDEGTIVARPQIYLGERFGVAVEGSYQARRLAVLDPQTGGPLVAGMWRGGIMPYFSPTGRGSFKRPQIYLVYVASARDSGARSLYPQEDVFSQRSVEHFAGVGAEWWFNSTSYP